MTISGRFPPGYTPFDQIAGTMKTWLTDGVDFSAFPDGTGDTLWPRLEQALAWDVLKAAGICVATGAFTWIPHATWRMDIPYRSGPLNQMERALAGLWVACDRYFGPDVHAAVRADDLARWLGADVAPEPPSILPGAAVTVGGTAPLQRQELEPPVPLVKEKAFARSRVDFGVSDSALVEQMHALIQAGRASSRWHAALELSERAEGTGTGESKAKRLMSRYSTTYPQR